MFNVKSNNQVVSRPSPFPTNYVEIQGDESLNNRNSPTTNQRNIHQTSISSTPSNDTNSGIRKNDNQRIARFVKFVNKTLPRSNSVSRSRNTRVNVIYPSEQSSNSVEPHQEQRINEQPSTSNVSCPEFVRPPATDRSSTTRASNETSNETEDDDDYEYIDVGDSSSSDDDDDAPFESMYNRRIPIPSLFSNARRAIGLRPGVRHNTRRHSLRRQSRYITPDQFNWFRQNQPSSTTYSSAYANILPLSLSHSRSSSLPSNSNVTDNFSEKISDADKHVNGDDDKTEDCLLCIEPLKLRGGRMILNPGCGHLMHMKCYMEYVRNCKDSCAICTKKFPIWDH